VLCLVEKTALAKPFAVVMNQIPSHQRLSKLTITRPTSFRLQLSGIPLIYELDEDMKPIKHPDAIAPLSGRYLGDQEEVKQRIGAVMAQTK
jgi:hypothetical protein